jgi:hypothetical protein
VLWPSLIDRRLYAIPDRNGIRLGSHRKILPVQPGHPREIALHLIPITDQFAGSLCHSLDTTRLVPST